MAKIKVYCLYDKVAKSFDTPFFVHNDGLACRAVVDSIRKNPESTLGLHALDYDIFCLGEYDHDFGVFERVGLAPDRVANIGDLISSQGA